MHPKILVVGCGLTGAGLLHFLRQHAPMATTTLAPKIASRSLDAVCWEASGREGGRMYTHYFPNGEWSDIGAQYLTQFSSECTDVFNYLLETHTIQPLFSASKLIAGMREEHKDIPHFIAPEGISSVVRQLVKGNADLHFGIIAKEINYDEHKKKLKVIGEVTNTGEVVEEYVDFLVITVPIPELLKLQGPLQKFIRDNLQLSAVKYSSR